MVTLRDGRKFACFQKLLEAAPYFAELHILIKKIHFPELPGRKQTQRGKSMQKTRSDEKGCEFLGVPPPPHPNHWVSLSSILRSHVEHEALTFL